MKTQMTMRILATAVLVTGFVTSSVGQTRWAVHRPPWAEAKSAQPQAAQPAQPADAAPAPAPQPMVAEMSMPILPPSIRSNHPLAATPTIAISAGFDVRAEQETLRLINQERARRGMGPLELDPGLTRVAREHCRLMAADHSIAHQYAGEPDLGRRTLSTGARFDHASENVALDSEGVFAAHNALMHSPHHRDNILTPEFNAIGIGALWQGDVLYITQDFIHRLPGESAEEAEDEIAYRFNQLRHQAGSAILPRAFKQELRDMACGMANVKRLDAEQPRRLPHVNDVVAFTVKDLYEVPTGMYSLRSAPATGFSVGACKASRAGHGDGVYWVLLVTLN